MEYLTADNIAIITTALLALSEALSLIPSIKSNGVFQLLVNFIKKVAGRGALGIVLVCLLLTGCATATIKTTTADGKLCEGAYTSLFLSIDQSAMSACGGKANATGSRVNTELLEAFMQALVPK